MPMARCVKSSKMTKINTNHECHTNMTVFNFHFNFCYGIIFSHIIIHIMAEIWENFAVIQINSKSQNFPALRYSHRTHIVHYFSLRIRVFLWNVWPFWLTMLAQTNQKFRDKCFPKQCAARFFFIWSYRQNAPWEISLWNWLSFFP